MKAAVLQGANIAVVLPVAAVAVAAVPWHLLGDCCSCAHTICSHSPSHEGL